MNVDEHSRLWEISKTFTKFHTVLLCLLPATGTYCLCHFVSTANLFEIVRTVRVHFNGFVWCCSFAELVLHTSNLIFYPIEASGTGGHWCFCNSILVTSIYSLVKNVIGCGGAVSQCVFVKHVQAVWFPWHLLDSWRVALLNDFEVV